VREAVFKSLVDAFNWNAALAALVCVLVTGTFGFYNRV